MEAEAVGLIKIPHEIDPKNKRNDNKNELKIHKFVARCSNFFSLLAELLVISSRRNNSKNRAAVACAP